MSTTTLPTISLKKFEHSARMSEETNCFSADVCFDGVPVMFARNDGRGGMTCLSPLPGVDRETFQKHIDILVQIHESRKNSGDSSYQFEFEKAERIVDYLVEFQIDRKRVERMLKTKTLFTVKGKVGIFQMRIPYDSTRPKANNIDVILNTLSVDDATSVFIAEQNKQYGI